MALNPPSELREVSGISEDERALIRAFMQGAVYCWVKNCDNKPFAVRDLVGGMNFDWRGTPLRVLYEKHRNRGKDNASAIEAAGIDLGWLVKAVLDDDRRTFIPGKILIKDGLVSNYHWAGNEP